MSETNPSMTDAGPLSGFQSLAPPAARLRGYRATPRPFNGLLRQRDPADLLGWRLRAFDFSAIINLGSEVGLDPDRVRDDIYQAVDTELRSTVPGRVSYEVADFSDVKRLQEPPRRYIVARLNTERETSVTTLFRCFVTQNSLYLAANSYSLGPVRWSRVALQAMITFAVLSSGLFSLLPALLGGPLGILLLVPYGLLVGAYLWWAWADVVRAGRAGDMVVGLRNRYPKPLADSSFDADDTLRFLKLVLPVILTTVLDELAVRGLVGESELDVLRDIRSKMRTRELNVTNNGGIMNIVSSNLGGSGNVTKA